MGKSDLIDKINARVKSQMSSLTARSGLDPRGDRKEERSSGVAEKRITSQQGKVVVRRRGNRAPPKPSEEQVPTPIVTATPAAAPPVEEVPEVTPVPEESSVPVVEQKAKADVAIAETVVAEVPPEPVIEAAVVPATASPVVETPAVAEVSPPELPPAAEPPKVAKKPATAVQEVIPVRTPKVGAVVAKPERTPAGSGSRKATSSGLTPSIEEILAKERGHVPVQRRAVVIGQVKRAPTPAPRVRPAKAVGTGTPSSRKGAKPAGAAAAPGPAGPPRVGGRGQPPAKEEDRSRPARRRGMKRKEIYNQRRNGSDNEPNFRRHRRSPQRRERAKTQLTTPKAIKRIIKIEDTITVSDLAHRMGVKSGAVIKSLMAMGMMATINQSIDQDTASLIAAEFGYEVTNVAFDEAVHIIESEDNAEDLIRRSPVVTVMGHVDHGKTTLLDAIRDTDVASGEAGGITQHIGAYAVQTSSGRVVFVDTPGHEAFTAMRARGAQVTDIVVLVVAADDGVMPQTVEALNHAKAAGVPIIVAVNKIDKEGSNPEQIKQKLTEFELVPEDWGGDTIFVEVSAKKRTRIAELLEMILLQAEMLELRANPKRDARAVVVESELDKGRGPVATVLVKNGTLRVGDFVVIGSEYGRVRGMVDDKFNAVTEAGPSTPVEILGLSGVPEAGDPLAVVADLEAARAVSSRRAEKARERGMSKSAPVKVTLEDLFDQLDKEDARELKLVIKTDVQGSIEALEDSVTNLSTDKVKTVVLHTGVGTISEGDIMLASASDAIVLGFNVKADTKALELAELEGVQIKTYSVIYEAIEDIRAAMTGMLKPIQKELVVGHAEVRETFSIPKIGLVAGSSVTDGKIGRSAFARLLRGAEVVWEGKLASLRRFKDDVREVEKGYECGIGLEGWTDVRTGDVIEAYIFEEIQPTL